MNRTQSKSTANRSYILVIEDDDEDWLIMERAMQQCFSTLKAVRISTLTEALTHVDAWEQAAWDIPKLILLDLYLPMRQAGMALLERLTQLTTPLRVPVLVCSGSNNLKDINSAYKSGATSYVTKPNTFPEWLTLFDIIRTYWWEINTLPSR